MYKFLLISLLAAFATLPLCGEVKTYWEARNPYHKLAHIFWNVRSLDNTSVRYEEFTKALDDFKTKSYKLQKKVEEYQLGDDLMFDQYATKLEWQIKKNGYNRKNNRYTKGSPMEYLPVSHLFDLISNDFNALREAGIHNFPTPEILQEWVPVFQYIRLFRYYRLVADKIEKYSVNHAWGQHFDNRLALMLKSAENVQKILQKEMPQLVKFHNLHTETRVLLAYCRYARKNNSIPDADLKNFAIRTGSKSSKKDYNRELKRDMRLAMQHIEHILNRFQNEIRQKVHAEKRLKDEKKREQQRKQQEKQRDQLAKERQLKKEQAADQAKKRALTAQEKTQLNKMSDDDLAEHLAGHYNAIFPADSQKSVSSNQVQKCMDALTDTQKEYYESVKARYLRSGNSEKQAELKALKTVRPLLSTSQLRPSRGEMIQMLKKD